MSWVAVKTKGSHADKTVTINICKYIVSINVFTSTLKYYIWSIAYKYKSCMSNYLIFDVYVCSNKCLIHT